MPSFPRRACALLLLPAASAAPAAAEPVYQIPTIVVTPDRVATEAGRTGSTVTVIRAEDIARSGAGTAAGLLRTVPGLTVTESGGVGSETLVAIRGAPAQHTLVLIDGVRVNDPSATKAQFDFSSIALADIERIEVLRGPQTALYGSDAMGGVVNIITRRRSGTPSFSATVEGGSYGTTRASLSGGGSSGPFSLSGGLTWFRTDGFSRVGDRDAGERDGTEKLAGTLNGAVDPGQGVRLEFGLTANRLHSDTDKSATADAAGYGWDRDLYSGFARLLADAPPGGIGHSLTAFGMAEDGTYDEVTKETDYRARSFGGEYQGTWEYGPGSLLLFGGRLEEQEAELVSPTTTVESTSDLFALFALTQFSLGERLHLSVGGRHDGEFGGEGFTTGRITVAYDIPASETTLRASIGTGANRPTAYQLHHPVYGTPGLSPERSIGADAGIDQVLLDGRLTVSATAFWNRFDNLIAFDGVTSKYENIAEAETAGIELAADAVIVPGTLRGRASYTFLHTEDLATGQPLQRRPEHSAALTLTYTGIDRLEVGASAVLVGARFNRDGRQQRLDPYARLDLNAEYRLTPQATLFARVENLLDARYQEILGYNTAGLSAYAGLRWTSD